MSTPNRLTYYRLAVNPEPWAIGPLYVKPVGGGKKIPGVGRNTQLAAYQDAIREALAAFPDKEELFGKVRLEFYFWRNRAEYLTPQARTARKHEADVTNLQKATEDALQGIFFKNDRDVADVRSMLVEQGPDVTPAVIVGIGAAACTVPSVVQLQYAKIMQATQRSAESLRDDNKWGNSDGPSAF